MKIPFSNQKHFAAFTLVEVLIASFIFVVVGVISVTVFVNILRIQQRISLENAVYEDGRFMMERIAREIRQNTVDYEEYYNKLVENRPYGTTYGCYGTRFYNPGSDGPNTGRFGSLCNNGQDPNDPANAGCIIDKTTLDTNTGKNPFEGNPFINEGDPQDANAFCDLYFANSVDPNCGTVIQNNHTLQNELYLIDAKGTQKTFIARKQIADGTSPAHSIALLRLQGEDFDKDGLTEKWVGCTNNALCCANDFNCEQPVGPSGETTLESTLLYNQNDQYKGFIPLSPSRTNITSLQFYIAPLEDPRKAFAEDDPAIQQQPHVTVLMTLQPSPGALQNYSGEIPTITLQTTITSRVYNEVKSYYGQGVCLNGY